MTAFQRRVYETISSVHAGRVTTYRDVARFIGCGSARAVGQALKRNPFAPEIPCHRVIASDLTIGGFQGRRTGATVRRKIAMLAAEGVRFKDGRLAEPDRLFVFQRGGRKTGIAGTKK